MLQVLRSSHPILRLLLHRNEKNDKCADAIALETIDGSTVFTLGQAFSLPIAINPVAADTVDTTALWYNLAGLEGEENCITSSLFGGDDLNPRYGVWYTLTVDNACEIDLSLTTCNYQTSFDVAISVYKGICGSLECVEGADDTCGGNGLQAALNFLESVDNTETYYILVHSGNSEIDFTLGVGEFQLEGSVSGKGKGSCGGDPHFAR